jgi:hypothetical protein
MLPCRVVSYLALIGFVLYGVAGCGGGTPSTGEMAVRPADYAQKEKANIEGFKQMMKDQAKKHKTSR